MPDAEIIGIDYSVRSAGLHDPVFDDVVIHRPWSEFDTPSLKAFFEPRLDAGVIVLSTLDLEGYWLSTHFGNHDAVLSPPADAFSHVAKPPDPIPELEHIRTPRTMDIREGRQALHRFLRLIGFDAWIKGPFHQALRVTSWEDFDRTVEQLRHHWPYDGVVVQEHVHGTHEAIAFCALRGVLLDAFGIVKNDMTAAGKTVAATRRAISSADRSALAAYAERLGWHGGGEIELVRDGNGTLWPLEINARFPSWVDGARQLGVNLPGRLVRALRGESPREETVAGSGFVRVQLEVPVREGYELLKPLILRSDEPLDSAKTAFNVRELARHLRQGGELPIRKVEPVPNDDTFPGSPLGRDVARALAVEGPTPRRELSIACLDDRIGCILAGAREAGVEAVYSTKTNPDLRVLERIHAHSMGVDVISEEEYFAAKRIGIPASKIVINGPAKSARLVEAGAREGALIFADSLGDLSRLDALSGRCLGLRLRPVGVRSRFGMPLEDPSAVISILKEIARISPASIAVHMHIAHSSTGRNRWRGLACAVASFADVLSRESGLPLAALNLGGGFYPDETTALFNWLACAPFANVLALSSPTRIMVEPGRAIAQPAGFVLSRVLEIRETSDARDVVVDASIAEISEADHLPHRIVGIAGDRTPYVLGYGRDRLLGRTCMEADIVAARIDLSKVQRGQVLAILDAGGYDSSMEFRFGRA
jgi:diaminopimelate decarboxylase